MSDHDEFEDDLNEDAGDGSDLVKNLRRQLKAQKKLLDETTNELSSYRAEKRKSSVAELIQQAGGDPRYAKFYTSEDASEDAVKAWIQSESELLGVKAPDEPDAQADQVQRLTDAVNSAPQIKPGSTPDLVGKMRSAKTREEFEAALASAFPRT